MRLSHLRQAVGESNLAILSDTVRVQAWELYLCVSYNQLVSPADVTV